MSVHHWTPAWWRRAQLIWIVPYLAFAWLPIALCIGLADIGNPFSALPSIWKGRS